MISINVNHTLGEAALFYKTLPQNLTDKAMVRALNRTAITVRAEASRRIRERYNLKSRVLKDQIRIRNATKAELHAVVQASGRPIPLVEFDARRGAAGATVRVGRTRKTVSHAFIATMKSGHRGVFLRVEKGSRKYRSTRVNKSGADLPVAELFGPSLPQAFTSKQVMSAIVAAARTRFPKAFEQEARFYLSKAL